MPEQQAQQAMPVGIQRDIGHSHMIARHGLDLRQQGDIAFDAGDHPVRRKAGQPQLMRSADAIGIAIENQPAGHVVRSSIAGRNVDVSKEGFQAAKASQCTIFALSLGYNRGLP